MTRSEQQQIVDLLARQDAVQQDLQGMGSDFASGFQAGWGAAINAVRAYLEGSGLIPHS